MKDYVVVTAISMYRMRYVMSKSELEVASPGIKTTLTDNNSAFEVAKDVVAMNECEEFSQEHMGEYIVDTIEMAEDDVLDMFDREFSAKYFGYGDETENSSARYFDKHTLYRIMSHAFC